MQLPGKQFYRPGIPEEHLARIFEPAFTLKGNGDVTGSYAETIKGTGSVKAAPVSYLAFGLTGQRQKVHRQ